MTEQQFKELLKKYEHGTATPSEVRDVETFFDGYVNDALEEGSPVMGKADERKAKILEQIRRRHRDIALSRRRSYTTAWRVAASIALFLVVGAGIYFGQSRAPKESQQIVVADITPGGDKAILQLSDNSTITLDSIDQRTIPQGASLITSTNGQLVYSKQAESTQLIYNKIITPRGGQYQITLADGSKVWLNAASSLRYPVAFSGNERVVELTGEGYFEIANDPGKPFKVSLPTMQVEVLGTHFNIMAYAEEESIKTTLIEGSVNILLSSKEHESVRLNPGQQAQFDGAGVQVVTDQKTVDQAVAWRFGVFRFEDTDMETVMRQVSRWYDVDVEYEEGIEDMRFVGVVSRKANISSVLRIMEHTDAIHFEVDPGLIKVRSGPKPKND